MRLDPDGRDEYRQEFVTIPASDAADVEASFDGDVTWVPCVADGDVSVWLVRGPDGEPDDSTPTYALPLGRTLPLLRNRNLGDKDPVLQGTPIDVRR